MFPSLDQLVPHRGAALLLSGVLRHSPGETACQAHIADNHPYLDGARVDAVLALEFMAQAIAVHAALEPAFAGAPRTGYLLGSPSVEFFDGDFVVGDEIEITARPIHVGGSLAKYESEVRVRGTVRARGELSVFIRRAPGVEP